MKMQLGLLTFGVFLIFAAAWISACILGATGVENVAPLILLSTGVWTVVLAGVKRSSHTVDGDAFATFSWGVLFVVIGGSWFLSNVGLAVEFVIMFLLLLVGGLAAATALR